MDTRSMILDRQRNWIPPAELNLSRPRPVSLTTAGIILLVITCALGIGALVAGLSLGHIAVRDARESRRLLQEGVITEGLVTRLWRAREESRQPWMAYRFLIQKRNYEGTVKVPLRVWNSLKVGSSLPIRYVSSKPDISCPADLAR